MAGRGYGPLSLEALRNADRAGSAPFAGVHARWDDYVLLRLPEHIASCVSQGAVTPGEAVEVARRFEECRMAFREQPASLLHGDPGSHNFMVDESGIRAVIDWEDALLGDPLFDLASLCTFHPERRHAAILAAYGANVLPGSVAWTRFWLYFLRMALAKTVHRHRFGYVDRPDRPPASRRIQFALAKLAQGG
jgi:aminoglycoside phosphotransferase (APT) family kinase protein